MHKRPSLPHNTLCVNAAFVINTSRVANKVLDLLLNNAHGMIRLKSHKTCKIQSVCFVLLSNLISMTTAPGLVV